MLFRFLPAQSMDYFENLYSRRVFRGIAGVDEAGRGPLAGPVVSCASFSLPPGKTTLFDSKMISPRKRDELYEVVLSEALGVGIRHRGPGGDRSHQYPGSLTQSGWPRPLRSFPAPTGLHSCRWPSRRAPPLPKNPLSKETAQSLRCRRFHHRQGDP